MSDQWPVFGYDPAHTGHGTGATRPEWPIDVAWRHDFEGKIAWQAPVVDDRGRAFVHVKQTQVDAPNFRAIGSDGRIHWALRTSHGMGPSAPPPTIAGDRTVLPGYPKAWVVETESGGRLYEGEFHSRAVDHVAFTVVDGRVHSGFRAFDLETGDELWTYRADGPVYRIVGPGDDETEDAVGPTGHTPAVANGTVYVAGRVRAGATRFVSDADLEEDDGERPSSLVAVGRTEGEFRDEYDEWGHVHALDAATGQCRWSTEFDTPVRESTPTVVADGTVFVVDAEARLRSFDASDGREQWTVDLSAQSVAGWRPVVADGRVFVDDGEGRVLALRATDGREDWRFHADDRIAGPPAVVDGVAHVCDIDGGLYGIDVGGSLRWRTDVDTQLRTGPAVAASRLYVAGSELWCLESRG